MKYSLILVVAFLFSCTPKEKMCRISGTLDTNTDVPYVIFSTGKDIADTLHIVDGKFEFEKKLKEPCVSVLIIPGSKSFVHLYYVENSDLTLDIVGKDNVYNAAECVMHGSATHDLYMSYATAGQDFSKENSEAWLQNKLGILYDIASKNSRHFITKSALNYEYLIPSSCINLEYAKKIVELIERDNPGFKMDNLRKCISNASSRTGEFVDFMATDLSGQKRNIKEEFGDSYTLIDIWASWCGPCRRESPHYKAALEAFKEKGFKVIAVSVDTNQKAWEKAIKKDGIEGFMHFNRPGVITETELSIYKINGIPDNFLVDKDGVIISGSLRGEALENKLEQLYNK